MSEDKGLDTTEFKQVRKEIADSVEKQAGSISLVAISKWASIFVFGSGIVGAAWAARSDMIGVVKDMQETAEVKSFLRVSEEIKNQIQAYHDVHIKHVHPGAVTNDMLDAKMQVVDRDLKDQREDIKLILEEVRAIRRER